MIYYKDGGAKFMRPIHSREEYLKLRDSEEQQSVVRAVRSGNAQLKSRLIQMNYSCLPKCPAEEPTHSDELQLPAQ